jgi:hypothetical protein
LTKDETVKLCKGRCDALGCHIHAADRYTFINCGATGVLTLEANMNDSFKAGTGPTVQSFAITPGIAITFQYIGTTWFPITGFTY